MKLILFLLLAGGLMGQPVFVPSGASVSMGLRRHTEPFQFTGSMKPLIHGGEYFHYEPYRDGMELKVGELLWIVRGSDGKGATHTMTAQNKRAVLTSGMANRKNDGWTPKRKVLHESDGPGIVGVIRFIERKPVTSVAQVSAALR